MKIWVFWEGILLPVKSNRLMEDPEGWISAHGVKVYPEAIYFFWDGVTE